MKPQKNTERKKQRNTIAGLSKTVVFLIIGCLCIGMFAAVSARYLHETNIDNATVRAKEFYFESDLLDGSTHEIAAQKDTDGTTNASITFQLENHADELRYSDVDISYEVNVADQTESDTGTVDEAKTNDVTISYDSDNQILSKGSIQNQNVTLSNLLPGHTYLVTAQATSPYTKTLTGTIYVKETDTAIYADISDEGAYIEVDVWTADQAITENSGAKITYCEGLIPDNTDSLMNSAVSAASGKTESVNISSLDENSSHSYRFFKEDSTKSYSVKVNGTEVTVNEKQ